MCEELKIYLGVCPYDKHTHHSTTKHTMKPAQAVAIYILYVQMY